MEELKKPEKEEILSREQSNPSATKKQYPTYHHRIDLERIKALEDDNKTLKEALQSLKKKHSVLDSPSYPRCGQHCRLPLSWLLVGFIFGCILLVAFPMIAVSHMRTMVSTRELADSFMELSILSTISDIQHSFLNLKTHFTGHINNIRGNLLYVQPSEPPWSLTRYLGLSGDSFRDDLLDLDAMALFLFDQNVTFVHLSGVALPRYKPNITSPFSLYPVFSTYDAAKDCDVLTFFDRDAEWTINWSSPFDGGLPFLGFPCIRSYLSRYPGLQALQNPLKSLWIGPFFAGIEEGHIIHAMAIPRENNTVLISLNFVVDKLQTWLSQYRQTPSHQLALVDSSFKIVVDTTQSLLSREYQAEWGETIPLISPESVKHTGLSEALLLAQGESDLANFKSFTDSTGKVQRVEIQSLQEPNMSLVMVVEENDFLGEVYTTRVISIIIALAITGVGLMFALVLGQVVARPVRLISTQMRHLAALDLDTIDSSPRGFHWISEVHRLQKDLAHVVESFVTYEQESKQSVQWKNFVLVRISNVCHEIRNPLNGILGLAKIYLDDYPNVSSSTYHETLQTIVSMGTTLNTILNDTVDIGRIEVSAMTLTPSPVSVPDVFSEVNKLLHFRCVQNNVVLKYDSAVNATSCSIDKERFTQLIMNLVSNAVKFSRDGDVNLNIHRVSGTALLDGTALIPLITHLSDSETASRTIGIPPDPDAPMMLVSVGDTGKGLAPDDVQTLFTPFTQVVNQDLRITREEGTGLGLALCTKLVELFGGQIGVVSALDVGSVFWFSFPFVECQSSLPTTPTASYPLDSMRGLRVLVVDDNSVNRMVITKMLHSLKVDIETETAENGLEGVEILQNNSQPFHVVFMDVEMPVMDGITATRIIRKELQLDLPIIAVTGRSSVADMAACQAAGFTDHIAKPIRKESLIDIMVANIAMAGDVFTSISGTAS